jgi:hypothetical protein
MGKKSPSPPPAPDPVKTAEAQGKENRETAIANLETSMIDQYTPYGSLVYRPAGSTFGNTTYTAPTSSFDQSGFDAAMQSYNNDLAAWNQSQTPPPNLKGWQEENWFRNLESSKPVAPNSADFYTTTGGGFGGGAGSVTANGNPRYEAIQTLSPDQQRILDLSEEGAIGLGETANRQLRAVSDRLAEPFSIDALGARPEINEQTRDEVRRSIIDRDAPRQAQAEEALRTRLANMGFTDPSSDAYRAELDNLYRGQNDFALAADQAALGQAGTLYGLETDRFNRLIQDMITERSQPLNELSAMLSGTQVTNPSFVPTPQANAAPAPIADSIYTSYQADLNNYQQQLANQNAQRQGLFSLLGAGARIASGPFGFAGGF